MKNVLDKVNGKENKVSIFRALGLIMHSCVDENLVKKVVARIFDEFKDQEFFLNYFKMTWLDNNKILSGVALCHCYIICRKFFIY